VSSKEFVNAVLVWGFFTGANKLFPLHLPALEKISESAFAGNQSAANFLVQIATNLSWRVTALEKKQPKLMREIARMQNVWPIVGTTQPDWDKDAIARLNKLGLGQAMQHIDILFRKAGGCDANYPARCWAKAAVYCVNFTRIIQQKLAAHGKSTSEKPWQDCWKRGDEPAWVSKTKDLPNFSAKTRPQWAEVIRKMVREELPEFHLRPEWGDQRNSCKSRGLDKKGKIQNTILDDIISALKTITPNEISQSAENLPPNFGR